MTYYRITSHNGLGHAEGKESTWLKKERTGFRSRNSSYATYNAAMQSTFTTGVKPCSSQYSSKISICALPFICLPQPLSSQPPIILLPVWLEKLLENIALSPERQPKIPQQHIKERVLVKHVVRVLSAGPKG